MYGRARRLQALKIVIIVVSVILVVSISIVLFLKIFSKKDDNLEYSYLANYLRNKGYSCELLKYSGSSCKLNGDSSYEVFTRYDDGFEYIIRTDSYIITLYHVASQEKFNFKTNENAFAGYKNKNYTCKYKDSMILGLDECRDEETDEVLDLEAYKGKIESTMNELNKILVSSGYNVDTLINDYKWEK